MLLHVLAVNAVLLLSLHSRLFVDATNLIKCSSTNYIAKVGKGVIASPNFPLNYQQHQTCTYRFYFPQSVSSPYTLCFLFHRFNLPIAPDSPQENCNGNNLDFPDDSSGRIQYCGVGTWNRGNQVHITSNVFSPRLCWAVTQMYFDVRFTSHTDPGTGFYATWQVYQNDLPVSPNPIVSFDLGTGQRCTQPECTDYCFHGSIPDGHGCPSCNCLPARDAPCAHSNVTCMNRECIETSGVCDGIQQCSDASDEDYSSARCTGKQNITACDFEEDECGLDISLNFKRSYSSNFGPRYDHTIGILRTGNFVYSDYTFAGPGNTFAQMVYTGNVPAPTDKTRCLQFYYFMSGHVGQLNVYIDPGRSSPPVWTRSGNQGTKWMQGEVDIPPSNASQRWANSANKNSGNYKILFETVFRYSEENIALDDISILPEPCFGSDVSCIFELGFCGWTQEIYMLADILWIRNRGATPTPDTGPSGDVRGDGYYIYIEASQAQPDSIARLVSRPISNGYLGRKCLKFNYHMYGDSINYLRVSRMDVEQQLTEIWVRNGPQHNGWVQAIVPIQADGPFQLVFEAATGTFYTSDIAIDDILVVDTYCIAPTASPPPAASSVAPTCPPDRPFQCADGKKCISMDYVCDRRFDCLDGSDEANCSDTASTTGIVVGSIMGVLTLLVILLVIIIFYNRRRQMKRQNRQNNRAQNRDNPLSVAYFANVRSDDWPQVYTGDDPVDPYCSDGLGAEPPPPYTSVVDRPPMSTLTISLTCPVQPGGLPDQPPAYEIAIKPILSNNRTRSNSELVREVHNVCYDMSPKQYHLPAYEEAIGAETTLTSSDVPSSSTDNSNRGTNSSARPDNQPYERNQMVQRSMNTSSSTTDTNRRRPREEYTELQYHRQPVAAESVTENRDYNRHSEEAGPRESRPHGRRHRRRHRVVLQGEDGNAMDPSQETSET